MDKDSICPVCGWPGVPADRHHEIPRRCGTQFGLDDMPYASVVLVRHVTPDRVVGAPSAQPISSPLPSRAAMWRMLREQWVRDGMPWFSGAPPAGWDPRAQLERVDAAI